MLARRLPPGWQTCPRTALAEDAVARVRSLRADTCGRTLGLGEAAVALGAAEDRNIMTGLEAGAPYSTVVGRATARPTTAGNLTVAGLGVDGSRFEWMISRVAGMAANSLRMACG